MPIAHVIARQLEKRVVDSAHVRGGRLKQERGADDVFDFSLGNPEVEPPAATIEALHRVVARAVPGSRGYMPNPGFPHVRDAIAEKLRRDT